MTHIPRPPCQKCQTETMLAHITPGPSGYDFRTFECPLCDDVHKILVTLVDDPMISVEASGWLQGELRAPI
jgi:hypothetical protein